MLLVSVASAQMGVWQRQCWCHGCPRRFLSLCVHVRRAGERQDVINLSCRIVIRGGRSRRSLKVELFEFSLLKKDGILNNKEQLKVHLSTWVLLAA